MGPRIAALAVMLVLYVLAAILGSVSSPMYRSASGVEDVGHLLVPSLVAMVGRRKAEYVFWLGTLPLELFFVAIVLVILVTGKGIRLGIALYVAYFLHWLFLHATVLPPPDDQVWQFPAGVFTLGKPHPRDFWFSGHTANAVLIALAARRPPWARALAWANVAFQSLLVLAARTHYTIDVLGGIFVAYAVHRASLEVAAAWGRRAEGSPTV